MDMMTRKPRSKDDHLVSMKMICQSYGYVGFPQAWAAFFAYYTVVYDFGFKAAELNGKAAMNVIPHAENDVYNPSAPYFGNTNIASMY